MASEISTVQDAVDKLFTLRSRRVRSSQEVLDSGMFLFESGINLEKKMGDEYWSFLEQMAFAALDLGNLALADDCINQLQERFPEAPRVQVLSGMRVEAGGKESDLKDALDIYNRVLHHDESNDGIWKRRIAVYKQLGDTKKAVEDLCKYLDTFYTDVEGWLELADLYANSQEYEHSLQALSHAMVISPQNPFYVLQFAETAATMGNWELAYKMFLRCAEMWEDGSRGAGRRAWFGVQASVKALGKDGGERDRIGEVADQIVGAEGLGVAHGTEQIRV